MLHSENMELNNILDKNKFRFFAPYHGKTTHELAQKLASNQYSMPYSNDTEEIEDHAPFFLETCCALYDEKQRLVRNHLSTLQSVLCQFNNPTSESSLLKSQVKSEFLNKETY